MKYDLILAISSVFCIMLQLFALYFILMFPSFYDTDPCCKPNCLACW